MEDIKYTFMLTYLHIHITTFVGTTEGKRSLGKPKSKWQGMFNIKWILEAGYWDVN
jgi:hypothetical protein